MLLENLASGSDRKSCVTNQLDMLDTTNQKDHTYNVVAADLVGLTPGAHDEGVVESQDGDDVDTFLTELGKVLDVSGDVVHGAGGGECTWMIPWTLVWSFGCLEWKAVAVRYSPGTENRTTFLLAHSLEAL